MGRARVVLTMLVLFGLLAMLGIPGFVGAPPGEGQVEPSTGFPSPPSSEGTENLSRPAAGAEDPGSTERVPVHGQRRVTFSPDAREPWLGQGRSGLWRRLGLRGTLRDEDGNAIAEDLDPGEPIDVRLPGGEHAVTFVLPGYEPATLSLPDGGGDIDLGKVQLTPDARATVEFEGLPPHDTKWLQAQIEILGTPDPVGLPGKHRPSPDGRAEASWPLLSGQSYRVVLYSEPVEPPTPGIAALETTFTLEPGEHRTVVLGLSGTSILDLELAGVPQEARAGQYVVLGEGTARTDENGRCRFLGLPEGPLRPSLKWCLPIPRLAQGEALVDARTGAETIPLAEGRVRVRPARELLAIGFVAGDGTRRTGEVEEQRLPQRPETRVPLIERSWLREEPHRLGAFVEEFGTFWFETAAGAESGEGWFLVPLPRERATLTAVEHGDSAGEWGLVALRPEEVAYGFFANPIRGTRKGHRWQFPGMSADTWLLQWRYRDHPTGTTTAVETVVLAPGKHQEVTVVVPERVEVHGHFSNWDSTPVERRPSGVRLVGCDPRGFAKIEPDGSFVARVFGPRVNPVGLEVMGVQFAGALEAPLVSFDPRERTVVGSLPEVSVVEVCVRARLGGVSVCLANPAATQAGVDGFLGMTLPETDGVFRVFTQGGFQGMVRQERRETEAAGMVLGWFQVSEGTPSFTVDPGGRFVRVRAVGDLARSVTPEPPDWWTHGIDVFGHTIKPGEEPLRLWIPDGCDALVVDGEKRVPVPPDADEFVLR